MIRLLEVGETGILQNMQRNGKGFMNGATAVVTRAFGLHRRYDIETRQTRFAEGYGCDVVGDLPAAAKAEAKEKGISLIGWFIERDQIRRPENPDPGERLEHGADLGIAA